MSRFAQGKFIPTNPQKYVGKTVPTYRSGWEFTFMQFCDKNEHILQWASEPVRIPYRNPLTGKNTNYVPDFLIVYQNRTGRQIAEMVEIKPKKQSLIESKVVNARDRAIVAINHAKWGAAMAWCKQSGITFRVITEDDLFYQGKRK